MIYSVLLAAGMGSRMGSAIPKQFMELGGQTLLEISLDKFITCYNIEHIVVVGAKLWEDRINNIIKKYNTDRISVCLGGKTRQDSLVFGLKHLKNKFNIKNEDIVVTHDVARPFVTLRMINDNINVCQKIGAADTVVPCVDTIIQSNNDINVESVPVRKRLYLGQTPQTFYINEFVNIYDKLDNEYLSGVTDAVKILVEHGVNVGMVSGDYSNFKITSQFDLLVAKSMIEKVNCE